MKNFHPLSFILFTSLLLSGSLSAVTYNWIGAGGSGGSGNWNTSETNWDTGMGAVSWSNGNDAVFSGGLNETITLTENIIASTVDCLGKTNTTTFTSSAPRSLTVNSLLANLQSGINIHNLLTLHLNGANAFSGGFLNGYGLGSIEGNVPTAISAGQLFTEKNLNANEPNSINGGNQYFFQTSSLNANKTGAVNNNGIILNDNSAINVYATNALTSSVSVTFSFDGPGNNGGVLRLNGNSTAVGRINSIQLNEGIIENASPTLSTATLTVGNSLNSSFNGIIQDGGGALALVKTGSGTLSLSGGANSYTGGTIVNAGTLLANNGSGSATGAGNVTVAVGGTLGGTGIVGANNSALTEIYGTLKPGTMGNDLDFVGDLSLQSGSTVIMQIAKSMMTLLSDQVEVSDEFTIANGSILQVTLASGTLALGDTFDLFNWGAKVGNFNLANVSLPDLNTAVTGLSWDTSQLNVNGSISVIPEPSTWALMALGCIGFVFIRRRSQV